MRIGIVSTCFEEAPSGAERVARNLATCLSDNHQVVLVGFSQTHLVAWDLGGTVVHDIPLLGGQSLGSRLADGNLNKLLWHLRDTYRVSAPRALTTMARHLGLELVNTHTMLGLSISAWRSLAAAGIPTVHVFHDYSLLCIRGSFFRGGQPCQRSCTECRSRQVASKYLVEHSTTFVSPSLYCANRHEDAMNLPQGSVEVVTNAASASTRRIRQECEPCNLLFIGKLEPHKGVSLLVDALQEGKDLPVKITFIGAGSLAEELRNYAATDPRVRVLKPLRLEELQKEYLGAKWLLVPSIWPENAPMVAFEALATGLPLILSPAGGLPELARDSGAGVVVPGFAVSDWVKIIRGLCETDCDVERASSSAITYSASSTPDQMSRRYLEIFDRARSAGTSQA